MSQFGAMGWFTAALPIVMKSTLLLLVAMVVVCFLRRHSAAARHLIWLTALLAVLTIPLFSFLLPRWTVGLLLPSAMKPVPVGAPLLATRLPARGAPALLR